MKMCESIVIGGQEPCAHAAVWLVQVGTREFDAQYSCPQHLNMTCRALRAAEDRAHVALTVTEAS